MTLLENIRFLGYEVAMSRLVGGKPIIEVDKDVPDVRSPGLPWWPRSGRPRVRIRPPPDPKRVPIGVSSRRWIGGTRCGSVFNA